MQRLILAHRQREHALQRWSCPVVVLALVISANIAEANVWSVGLSGSRHTLKAGDQNELLGNSAAVDLGWGYISESWYFNGSLDIILGPYELARDKQLNVDYVGTGLSIWLGSSAQTLNLRSDAGGYGFALGLTYADIVGRSTGKNRKESQDLEEEDEDLIEDYSMRVTNLALLPAIFFCWLKEARPTGNSPEHLKTRLDGYILTLGAAMPLINSYHASYELRSSSEEINEKGRLRGYSIVLSFTAFLST